MLSFQLFKLIADERERTIQDDLRVRQLLRDAEIPKDTHHGRPGAGQPEPWRARTPRASATTR